MEYFSSIDYEEISATAGAAIGLTVAKINKILPKGRVKIYATAFPVAFRVDGGTPTGATVQQLQVGADLYLDSITEMEKFSAIGVGGTSVLAVDYAQYVRSN